MAAARQQLGRGAYDFAQKTCNKYLLTSENKLGKSAIQASSVSAGLLLGDIKNGGLFEADNCVTGGAPQDTYTRVTPLFIADNDEYGDKNIKENYYYGLNREFLPLNSTPLLNLERNIFVYRSHARFRRTFCTFRTPRCLFGGHGQFVFLRSYTGNGSEPLYKTKTGYYEILEVSPTATQAQIKTAYYKQSFVYHPDRNAGSDEATVRFSEISEAYTVLGNKALRKKYDRGLLTQSDLIATAKPSGKDTTGGSGKQQGDRRRSVVGADIRRDVYDFDKFFKTHYSEQLQREKDIRFRKEEMLRKKRETIAEKKLGRMMELGVVAMLALAMVLLMSIKNR